MMLSTSISGILLQCLPWSSCQTASSCNGGFIYRSIAGSLRAGVADHQTSCRRLFRNSAGSQMATRSRPATGISIPIADHSSASMSSLLPGFATVNAVQRAGVISVADIMNFGRKGSKLRGNMITLLRVINPWLVETRPPYRPDRRGGRHIAVFPIEFHRTTAIIVRPARKSHQAQKSFGRAS